MSGGSSSGERISLQRAGPWDAIGCPMLTAWVLSEASTQNMIIMERNPYYLRSTRQATSCLYHTISFVRAGH